MHAPLDIVGCVTGSTERKPACAHDLRPRTVALRQRQFDLRHGAAIEPRSQRQTSAMCANNPRGKCEAQSDAIPTPSVREVALQEWRPQLTPTTTITVDQASAG